MLNLLLALGVSSAVWAADGQVTYPAGFVWGAAFSAHQTEGKAGGAENGDWWNFEHSLNDGKSPIAHGDTTDVATDHWNRFDEDFAQAEKLGLDSVRLSLAWEKIEPKPGQFDVSVLDHYRQVLQSMRTHHLKPVVALHHFTHPLWFHAQGGWTDAKSAATFLEYSAHVVAALGNLCDTWITFNEPMVLVWLGYIQGTYPPNHHSPDNSYGEGVQAAISLARAHRLVTAMIHREQPPSASTSGIRGVGLVNSLQLYQPLHAWNPVEALGARVVASVSNWAFPSLALEGRISASDRLLIRLAGGPSSLDFPADEAQGNPVADWFGINYYTRYFVQAGLPHSFKVSNPEDPAADNGWGIYPEGLEEIVRETASRVHIPLVVSENGLADASDRNRPDMIRKSLQAVDRLVASEVDLRGYFHWSLTDNFEWLWGYQYRFGLIAIEPGTLARVPRPSADVYRLEIQARRH
jgi:beta-glucosidase